MQWHQHKTPSMHLFLCCNFHLQPVLVFNFPPSFLTLFSPYCFSFPFSQLHPFFSVALLTHPLLLSFLSFVFVSSLLFLHLPVFFTPFFIAVFLSFPFLFFPFLSILLFPIHPSLCSPHLSSSPALSFFSFPFSFFFFPSFARLFISFLTFY